MDFGTAVGRYFSNYFNFQDRARRAEFWWPVVMQLLVYLVLIFAHMTIFGVSGQGEMNAMSLLLTAVWLIFGLACLIPTLAVSVRRLHDKDMSGWWYLINLVPFGSLVLLFMYATEGTQGPNKYGPDPKDLSRGVF